VRTAISATDAGSVALIHGEVALADLSLSSVEGGDLVFLPEAGTAVGLLFGILGLAALKQARVLRDRRLMKIMGVGRRCRVPIHAPTPIIAGLSVCKNP